MKQSRLLCTPQGTLSTMPSYKRGLRLTARSSVGIFLTLAVAPQLMGQARCDPELVRLARGASVGYGPRQGRCEGIFSAPVSAPPLIVASFTRAFPNYDPAAISFLTLRWDAPTDSAVVLRARSVKRELYYAMDAVRAPATREFNWSAEILSSQRIRRQDVGVVGLTRLRVGKSYRTVYVPLRISAGADVSPPSSYEVLVFPTLELREVFVSLTPLDAEGKPGRAIITNDSLKLQFYPQRRPVRVVLRDPGIPGLYMLEIRAESASGRSIALDPLIFYHARD